MKRKIGSLIKAMSSSDSALTGGFGSLRGGKSAMEPARNVSCTNTSICSGTNTDGCTNSGNCVNTTNSAGECTNATCSA